MQLSAVIHGKVNLSSNNSYSLFFQVLRHFSPVQTFPPGQFEELLRVSPQQLPVVSHS